MVHLAQYGGACASNCIVPMLLNVVPGLSCLACAIRPAAAGFVVSLIGDQLGNRKMSTKSVVAPIAGAFIGDYCITSLCGGVCAGVGLAAFLPGMIVFVTGLTSRNASGALVGAAGYIAGISILVVAILGGQLVAGILSPIVPTLAYHLFAEGEPEPAPAAAAAPAAPATTRRHIESPTVIPTAAGAVAY